MKLFIIRHAEAVDLADDAKRTLSNHGREQVADLARFFRRNGRMQPAAVWHSPLVRAVETASLLAKGVGWDCELTEMPGLRPEDDPAAIAKRLMRARDDVAIVGHEPHLSALTTILLTGRAFPTVVTMKKGACLALEGGGEDWSIRWLVSPSLL